LIGEIGKREPTVRRQPSNSQLHSIDCVNTDSGEFIKLTLDISKENELFFLLNTGADVSVINSKKLISTTEFEPQQKVRLKCVDGSIVETHGLVKAQVLEGNMSIPMELQLVSKQVDLEGDGILGKDFLQQMKAQICYKNKKVRFKWKKFSFEKNLTNRRQIGNKSREVRTITLQKRSETIVQMPVDCEDNQKEGLIEKCEINTGIFVASSLTAVNNGYVMTSILNTNDHEVVLPEPKLKLARIEGMSMDKEGVTKRNKY
jgi:hypothetical protein